MCKKSENITHQATPKNEVSPRHFDQSKAAPNSDIYNTVPLMQFEGVQFNNQDYVGMALQKQSFISSYYKTYNIQLAKKLEECQFSQNKVVQAQIKGLSCCSHLSKIVLDDSGMGEPNAYIERTSDKCKRSLCPRCSSIKASRNKKRFLNAYKSEECKELFEGKYFYFITLTLKHNTTGTRSDVYLNQLKKYVANLRRSELWKQYFPYSKAAPLSGYAQSYELTITENGFHIHSHILMCCPRIQHKIKKVQDDFRLKWFQLTGDSTGFNIDLVRTEKPTDKDGKGSIKLDKVIGEILKYTVKSGTDKQLTDNKQYSFESGKLIGLELSKIDLLAEWLICTHSQKMLTSNGFLKGLQLFTTGKSKWDLGDENAEGDIGNSPKNFRYFVGRTAQLKYNHSLKKGYKRYDRERVLNSIYVKEIPSNFIEITDCVDEFDKYFNLQVAESDASKFLSDWVRACELERKEFEIRQTITQEWIDRITPNVPDADIVNVEEFIQLNLFEDY